MNKTAKVGQTLSLKMLIERPTMVNDSSTSSPIIRTAKERKQKCDGSTNKSNELCFALQVLNEYLVRMLALSLPGVYIVQRKYHLDGICEGLLQ